MSMPAAPIKAGDLLYAVGPRHSPPHDAQDLQIYSTPVTRVAPEGSYSKNATPADFEGAVFRIELGTDRPFIGFPKWVYHSYDIGGAVHLSATEALHAFLGRARSQLEVANRTLTHAQAEINWAIAAEAILKKGKP